MPILNDVELFIYIDSLSLSLSLSLPITADCCCCPGACEFQLRQSTTANRSKQTALQWSASGPNDLLLNLVHGKRLKKKS